MSTLLGADIRRVDLIAEGLCGHSQDIDDLRAMAQRAVAEMRSAWAGPDFESIARRWEQEAGPHLTDVSTALCTMAGALRAQAEGQRQASGNTGSPSAPAGSGGALGGVAPGGGEKTTRDGQLGRVGGVTIGTTTGDQTDTGSSTVINGHQVGTGGSLTVDVTGQGGPERAPGDGVTDNAKLTFAQGDLDVDARLASLAGGNDSSGYELSVGKVQAAAEYSAALDEHGNLVASVGASGAAYAGYAAGTMRGGSDFANGTVGGKAYVGAEAKADLSGSIGPGGAKGHLGAEAFAGAKVEGNVSGTVAGLTAAAGAEISYGIGAHADVDADLSATKVGVLVDVGVTLGIGAGVTFDVSVSPQEVISNVDHAVDEMGDAAQDVGQGLSVARDQVARFLDW